MAEQPHSSQHEPELDSLPAPPPVGVWIGAMVVLVGAFVRAVCPAEPFPWWGSDPFLFSPPIAGLTPTWSLGLDLVILLGAIITLVIDRSGLGRVASVLFSLGLGVLCYHVLTDPETVQDAADVAASLGAIAAAWVACRDGVIRRVFVGVTLGFGMWLAAYGALQVFIEHPATLRSFELTKDDFYQARGWDPNGPKAAMYVERLSHPQPTATFGLTNVYATFAGAALIGLLACVVQTSRTVRLRLALGAAALVAGAALFATGSKGGIGSAAAAGLVVLVARRVRPGWVGRAVLFAAIGVCVAVALRGLAGDRFDEKSLLFRSQYQRGTMAVWAEDPIVGTGPGGFQEAYTRLKPPEAPEDVTSPHSVWFDWVGTLGLGGAALGLMLAWGWSGRDLPDAPHEPRSEPEPDPRIIARLVAGVVGSALLACTACLRLAMTPERALAILIGSVGWGVVGVLVATGKQGLRSASLAIGAVAIVHAQLDVSPVWTVSAPAWGVLIGIGLGSLRVPKPGVLRWIAPVALTAAAMLLGWRMAGIARWEAALRDAAAIPAKIGQLRTELIASGPGISSADLNAIDAELHAMAPDIRKGSLSMASLRTALDAASAQALDPTTELLRGAVLARPTHLPTRSALGSLLLSVAARDAERDPEGALDAMGHALRSAKRGTERAPDSAEAWTWLGRVLDQHYRMDRAGLEFLPEPDAAPWLDRAAEAWARAAVLTPHDPEAAARVAETYAEAGRPALAAEWAARAIEADDRLILDPIRRLPRDRRLALEAILSIGG